MEVNIIREAIRRHPFVPFRIRMVDGREFLIFYPEVLALSPTNRSMLHIQHDGLHVHLNPMLVVSLEYQESPDLQSPPETPANNGTS